MCSGSSTRLRDVGEAELAARNGNMQRYDAMGGAEGDQYRSLRKQAGGAISDPLARLGVFSTADVKSSGAESFRNQPSGYAGETRSPNPFYTTVLANRQTPAQFSSFKDSFVPKKLPEGMGSSVILPSTTIKGPALKIGR